MSILAVTKEKFNNLEDNELNNLSNNSNNLDNSNDSNSLNNSNNSSNSSTKTKKTFFGSLKEGLNKEYTVPFYGKDSLMNIICFFVNCLIFPAIFFQMRKTYIRGEAADFNPFFVLLQFFGGAPEGMIGAIIGYMLGNTQMFIIGLYAMFYNAYMLSYRLYGKNGLLVKKNKKK